MILICLVQQEPLKNISPVKYCYLDEPQKVFGLRIKYLIYYASKVKE